MWRKSWSRRLVGSPALASAVLHGRNTAEGSSTRSSPALPRTGLGQSSTFLPRAIFISRTLLYNTAATDPGFNSSGCRTGIPGWSGHDYVPSNPTAARYGRYTTTVY